MNHSIPMVLHKSDKQIVNVFLKEQLMRRNSAVHIIYKVLDYSAFFVYIRAFGVTFCFSIVDP